MIVLINGGPALDRFGLSPYLGRLISPRCGNVVRPGEVWAGDNDAFGAWDEDRYLAMLNARVSVPNCLFMTAPDVVGDAMETLLRFWDWNFEIAGRGYPVALVGQDGVEDRDVPWDAFDCWFIGGSTEFKLSAASADLAREARSRGKHVHMGRVNTKRRIRQAREFACDSIDGTGWSRWPDHYLKNYLPCVKAESQQGMLF